MGFLQSIKQLLGQTAAATPTASHAAPGPIVVPEVTPAEVMAERRSDRAPFILDCREHSERRQGYIPGSRHIVMREIPFHLNELDQQADIIVVCAHGNRSLSVAGYLIEQGYRARSLRGGTVGWQAQGGAIERG